MFVAWRDLRFARGRFALIGTVVALISVLVGFLSGLTGGLAQQNVSGVLNLGADRVVLGPSVAGDTPRFADSAITPAQQREWTDASGVMSVVPLGLSQTRAQTGADRTAVAIFATTPGKRGAPAEVGEITLSAPAAKALRADVGDIVAIAETTYSVSAVRGDEWYSHTPVVWLTLADWQAQQARIGGGTDAVTALLVAGDADWSAIDTQAGTMSTSTLESLTLLPAFRSEIGSLLLIVALLFGISALVIGAFFTVWTMQRRADVAILKALGATTGALVRDALGQALVVLLAGTALGTGIVVAAGVAVSGVLPFLLSPWTTIAPAILMVVVGAIGAAFALRTVTTSDPLTALGSNR
jgi:putative ABC transport system permease protein